MRKSFYNTKQWKEKRKYIMHRDKYLCQECKKYGKNKEAYLVHHIKEVEEYPELKLKNDNLVSVCNSCHNKLHPEKGGHRIKR